MPDAHRRYAEWTPSRILRWAETIGPQTAAIAREVMERRPHPEQGFRSCLGIIRLAKQYDVERLERACRRARAIGALSYRSVQSILKTGLDQQPVPPAPLPEQVVLIHDHIRGPEYYERGET
jgi:transposase